jgi:hypothetical protein
VQCYQAHSSRMHVKLASGLGSPTPWLIIEVQCAIMCVKVQCVQGTILLSMLLPAGIWHARSVAASKVHIALRGMYGAYAAIHDLESGEGPQATGTVKSRRLLEE